MSEFDLIRKIIELSFADKWDNAKKEWSLIEIIEAESPETCLCGHYPIIELCELKNNINGNTVIVGNICVKKFLGISSDKIYSTIKKLRKSIENTANIETIEFLYSKKEITDWEKEFYSRIARIRNLSDKQLKIKIEINNKILKIIKRKSPVM